MAIWVYSTTRSTPRGRRPMPWQQRPLVWLVGGWSVVVVALTLAFATI